MDVIDILGRGDLPAAVPAERTARPASRASSAAAPETDGTRFSRELNSAVSGSSTSPAPAAPANKTPAPSAPAVPTAGPVESSTATAVGHEAAPESLSEGDVGSEPVAPLPLLVLPTIVAPVETLDGVLPEVGDTELEGELQTQEPTTSPPAFLAAMAAAMNCQRPSQIAEPVEPAVAEGGAVATLGNSESAATAPVGLSNWLSQSLGATSESVSATEVLPPVNATSTETADETVSTTEVAAPVVVADQMTAAHPVMPPSTAVLPLAAPPVTATTSEVITPAVAPPQPVAVAPTTRQPAAKTKTDSGEQPAALQPNVETRPLSPTLQGSPASPAGTGSTEPVTDGTRSNSVSAAGREATEALAATNMAPDGNGAADVRSATDQSDPRSLGLSASAAPVAETTESTPVLQAGTISPSDQQFAERLSQYILQSHEQDQQLSVKITPPDLGTIVIRVQAGAEGLSVEMEASNASTQQLLTDQVPQLQEALSQLGRPAERIDILRHETGREAGAQGDRGTAGGSQQSFAERREAPPSPRIVIPNPRAVPTETAAAAPPSGGPRLMQELNVKI